MNLAFSKPTPIGGLADSTQSLVLVAKQVALRQLEQLSLLIAFDVKEGRNK